MVSFLGIFFLSLSLSSSPYQQIKSRFDSSDQFFYSEEGELLFTRRKDFTKRSFPWIQSSQISEHLKNYVIKIEDKRFYEHHGVDYYSVGSALKEALQGNRPRGFSTISMQLVSLIEGGLGRKNIFEKLSQVSKALVLERSWSKEEILEGYLNLAGFRGEVRGVYGASRVFFNKEAKNLNKIESIILVTLLKSPSFSLEKVFKRSCFFYQKIEAQDCHRLNHYIEKLKRQKKKEGFESLRAARFLRKKESPIVRTTIKAHKQRKVEKIVSSFFERNENPSVSDAAVVVLENKSGKIVSYIANTGKKSASPYVDNATSLRQVGSTLKPFIYGMGLEKKIFTEQSLISDEESFWKSSGGLYRPNNYDNSFRGIVTLRDALGSSLNIPAVKALELIGLSSFLGFLEKMNLPLQKSPSFYGPSLALGSIDLSLLDLTNAYRMLARGGLWEKVKDQEERNSERRKLFSEEVSFIISDILSDSRARRYTFGYQSLLDREKKVSVKTGTSKDMRDNWCLGYNEEFTVGVWVGNQDGSPMMNSTGLTGAGPLWAEIIDLFHSHKKTKVPKSLIVKEQNGEKRFFLKGTEPELLGEIKKRELTRSQITYPIDGMVLSYDPDIPEASQKILISYKGRGDLFVDGEKIAENLFSLKKKGSREITLSQGGTVLDRVKIYIK